MLADEIFALLAQVPDPEIPVISLTELGIIREVRMGAAPEVVITPTYTGCPASLVIEQSIRAALDAAGFADVRVRTALAPAWTTDWISQSGRSKLLAYGIAPPETAEGRLRRLDEAPATCPQCGSADTREISRFGSTPCKALWRCLNCAEPFDRFKCL